MIKAILAAVTLFHGHVESITCQVNGDLNKEFIYEYTVTENSISPNNLTHDPVMFKHIEPCRKLFKEEQKRYK